MESGRVNLPSQDSIVEEMVSMLRRRSAYGIEKYGVSLDRDDLSLDEWLQHAIEECLDQALYLIKTRRQLRDNQNV